MQVSADTTLRPVAPTQEISDKLSGLSAGQRVMAGNPGDAAERDLPGDDTSSAISRWPCRFLAKSDSLGLMVTENDGKRAGGALTWRCGGQGGPGRSASATLRCGQLIGELFANARAVPRERCRSAQCQSADSFRAARKRGRAGTAAQTGDFTKWHVLRGASGGVVRRAFCQGGSVARAAGKAVESGDAGRGTGETGGGGCRPSLPGWQILLIRRQKACPPWVARMPRLARTAATTWQSAAQLIAPHLCSIWCNSNWRHWPRSIFWQGQAWPGRRCTGKLMRDAAQQGQEGEAGMATWATRLRLHLPAWRSRCASSFETTGLVGLCGQQVGRGALMRAAGSSWGGIWKRQG